MDLHTEDETPPKSTRRQPARMSVDPSYIPPDDSDLTDLTTEERELLRETRHLAHLFGTLTSDIELIAFATYTPGPRTSPSHALKSTAWSDYLAKNVKTPIQRQKILHQVEFYLIVGALPGWVFEERNLGEETLRELVGVARCLGRLALRGRLKGLLRRYESLRGVVGDGYGVEALRLWMGEFRREGGKRWGSGLSGELMVFLRDEVEKVEKKQLAAGFAAVASDDAAIASRLTSRRSSRQVLSHSNARSVVESDGENDSKARNTSASLVEGIRAPPSRKPQEPVAPGRKLIITTKKRAREEIVVLDDEEEGEVLATKPAKRLRLGNDDIARNQQSVKEPLNVVTIEKNIPANEKGKTTSDTNVTSPGVITTQETATEASHTPTPLPATNETLLEKLTRLQSTVQAASNAKIAASHALVQARNELSALQKTECPKFQHDAIRRFSALMSEMNEEALVMTWSSERVEGYAETVRDFGLGIASEIVSLIGGRVEEREEAEERVADARVRWEGFETSMDGLLKGI